MFNIFKKKEKITKNKSIKDLFDYENYIVNTITDNIKNDKTVGKNGKFCFSDSILISISELEGGEEKYEFYMKTLYNLSMQNELYPVGITNKIIEKYSKDGINHITIESKYVLMNSKLIKNGLLNCQESPENPQINWN